MERKPKSRQNSVPEADESQIQVAAKRRGATVNPPNRFEKIHSIPDSEFHNPEFQQDDLLPVLPTELYRDETKEVIAENDSPDLPFRYSINPYRGCAHGCTYCYARPYHEYLGWNAGIDFETKLVYKENAADLLRDFLSRPTWVSEPIMLSGVTDCYQPIERSLQITRQCLEVMLEARQPVSLITKSRLILRDLDLLQEMARKKLVHVVIALTTLDPKIVHAMEPRAAMPKHRLEVMTQLSKAGVPIRCLIAPVVPGLTDSEIPAILTSAKDAGALAAGYTMLRLPGAVRIVFLDWLRKIYPEKAPRVESLVTGVRGGEWNDSRFHSRMRGQGEVAEQINRVFQVFTRKLNLSGPLPPLDSSQFRPPRGSNGEQWLF